MPSFTISRANVAAGHRIRHFRGSGKSNPDVHFFGLVAMQIKTSAPLQPQSFLALDATARPPLISSSCFVTSSCTVYINSGRGCCSVINGQYRGFQAFRSVASELGHGVHDPNRCEMADRKSMKQLARCWPVPTTNYAAEVFGGG